MTGTFTVPPSRVPEDRTRGVTHLAESIRQESPDQGSAPPGRWALASRPAVYTFLLLTSMVAAVLFTVRRNGIFACQAADYSPETYLSYCQATGYGDYDHGAFWFDLEPDAIEAAQRADVLFIGNSRMQMGLSTPATSDWFASRDASYYLLGFSHNVNFVFETHLLAKLHPRARVYVLNVDRFFRPIGSAPAQAVLGDSTARARYETKRDWQPVHRTLCRRLPSLCGDEHAFFRSRPTGAWKVAGGALRVAPVSYADGPEDGEAVLPAYGDSARKFVASLPVPRECVILTYIPYMKTDTATANSVARALGMDLVAPRLDGLATFDQSHLDQASALRWSTAFYETAGPRIAACLDSAGATGRQTTGGTGGSPR
jgi:hypothetical protein